MTEHSEPGFYSPLNIYPPVERTTPKCDLCDEDLDAWHDVTVLIPDYYNAVHAECGAEYLAERFGLEYREDM